MGYWLLGVGSLLFALCEYPTSQYPILSTQYLLLKIPALLPVFHGCFPAFVIRPGTSFGGSGGGYFCDDLVQVIGQGFDSSGDGHIPTGAVTYHHAGDRFTRLQL